MSDHSRRMAAHLSRAAEVNRDRRRWLNEVADGTRQMTPTERAEMMQAEKRIRELLDHLSEGVAQRLKVVSVDDVGSGSGDQIPERLKHAYALLVHQAYGSDPAVGVGDPAVIRGIGRRRARTSTNQTEDEIGAARQRGKRPGASRRNVIKDRRAYELKLRADRRLRRLAGELEEFLSGAERTDTVNACSRCGRIGEDEWAYCPHCGHEMKVISREGTG